MNLYLQAAVISMLLFVVGVVTIKSLDDYRLGVIKGEIDTLKTDIEDSKLFLLYSQTLGDNSTLLCQALKTQIGQRIDKNQGLIVNLQKYEEANVFGEEYYSLKTFFVLKNLELWLYTSNYKRLCNSDQVSILYFYPDKAPCNECEVQANILTEIRDKCLNVKVFALPVNVEMNLLNIIKTRYNITRTPTIVINEEIVKEGVTNEEALLGLVKCN